MSTMTESVLAELLLEAETQLDKEREARIELELRIDALATEVNSLSMLMKEQKPVASSGKKVFNITVTGRDGEERIQTVQVI